MKHEWEGLCRVLPVSSVSGDCGQLDEAALSALKCFRRIMGCGRTILDDEESYEGTVCFRPELPQP